MNLLNFKVRIYDKKKHERNVLDKLLKQSDVITFNINYDEKNFNFLNNEKLNKCKKNVKIINTSRGEIIDEISLIKFLKKNKSAEAYLDCIKNEHKKKLICGLSWTSKNDDIGENKSISLETLKPILELENLIFIDLQYTDAKDERVKFVNYHGFPIYKIEEVDNFNDINGVVSLVDLCDFIITVSNTNAHIAGALGKKTFLLLPTGKGRLWYWHLSENNSTWYPSIEIIEQNYPGQWEPVINKLVGKVEGYLSERSS